MTRKKPNSTNMCPDCLRIMHIRVRTCGSCEREFYADRRKTSQAYNVKKWFHISKNERSASIGGRHYFASRCNSKQKWQIEELNQSETNGSRSLGIIERNMTTRECSLW